MGKPKKIQRKKERLLPRKDTQGLWTEKLLDLGPGTWGGCEVLLAARLQVDLLALALLKSVVVQLCCSLATR